MDFWSGLARGTEGLPDEIGELQKYARARRAAAALANSDFSGVGADPQPPPHPAAALAALSQPQPQPAPPAAPNPRSIYPVTPGKPDPLAPQPQAQPQPDPNLSATAQPGIDFGNPIREANQTWQSIIGSIKKANPKIDPQTLIAAAQEQLENLKGVAPFTKSLMYGQIQAQKMSFDYQYKNARLQQLGQKLEIDMKNAKTREQQEQALEEYHRQLAAIGEERAEDYGRNVDYSHEDRQSAEAGRDTRNTQNVQSRERIATQRSETQEDIAGQRSSDSQYRADQGFRGSQVRSGAPAGPAPQVRRGLPPDARKAPDGHFYAKRGGRWVRFD